MAIGIKKDLDKLMGRNLKRMREEQGWSQEKLAEMIESDRRYISALENGSRGIGKNVLVKLCEVLKVDESAFIFMATGDNHELYGLSNVMRMLVEELKALPEYEQLRILADLKERKAQT
jgi:transcriptional regulator with XRE-family HTH domain